MTYRTITRHAIAGDGTRLAFHTHLGPGSSEVEDEALLARPAAILTNGIGTTANFWRYLVKALSREYRVVHWDYRGHACSEVARSGDYCIRTQADDLRRVTEEVMRLGEHPDPPIHLAFSMGVAVLLELYRAQADLVRGMVLIAGGPDGPISWPDRARAALRAALTALTPLVPVMAPPVYRFLSSPLVYPAGRALGLLRKRAPREDIEQFMRAVCLMDPYAYWYTLCGLLEARASDVLPRVSVPAMVVAGSHDPFAPPKRLERMRDALPHAHWLKVEDTGHANLVEAGPEVSSALLAFLRHAQLTGARPGQPVKPRRGARSAGAAVSSPS
jgi:pimeloyl-ACP methyl ester carboxylesterase